jgi:acetylglutamate kinase
MSDSPKRRGNETGWQTAQVLSEALPFIQRYADQTVVIKFGGNAMRDAELTARFANDVVLLRQMGLRPVIVHGGGPQIGALLERVGKSTNFVDGKRVSDAETVDVAEMVLSGTINKSIVQAINQAGGRGVGLSGKDAGLITARAVNDELGFVGHPEDVNVSILETLGRDGFIPVISPISGGANGESFNVNADTVAGAVAGALGATRLLLLTDIAGVQDKDGNLLTDLSAEVVRGLIADGTAQGGMIPKLETALDAVEAGVRAVVILDGRRAHGLLVELFTDSGAGTLIR